MRGELRSALAIGCAWIALEAAGAVFLACGAYIWMMIR